MLSGNRNNIGYKNNVGANGYWPENKNRKLFNLTGGYKGSFLWIKIDNNIKG